MFVNFFCVYSIPHFKFKRYKRDKMIRGWQMCKANLSEIFLESWTKYLDMNIVKNLICSNFSLKNSYKKWGEELEI